MLIAEGCDRASPEAVTVLAIDGNTVLVELHLARKAVSDLYHKAWVGEHLYVNETFLALAHFFASVDCVLDGIGKNGGKLGGIPSAYIRMPWMQATGLTQ